MRKYSDAQLRNAVAQERSWRGVLRAIGLLSTSSAASRSVRRRADELSLDYSHFTGQRRWTDGQLDRAVRASTSWTQVASLLDLAGGSSTTTLRGHALRLGLDTDHFALTSRRSDDQSDLVPDPARLPRAGVLLAAAWFELCGFFVSWPLEPAPYDLLVSRTTGFRRVQVKTSRHWDRSTWRVKLTSTTRTSGTYDPDDVDDLFVVTADRQQYLIPFDRVAGLSEINMAAYSQYLVRDL